MELLKSLLSSPGIWCRRKAKARPDALGSSILAKLPPELIICIAEFLPPISATCFSLCCRPIHSLLIRYRGLFRDEGNFDTFGLLEVLERDLPDHIACYDCNKLHAIKDVKRHGCFNYFTVGPPCWTAGSAHVTNLMIGWDFYFSVFQMAMKRHRQGADPSPLLDLMCCKGERGGYGSLQSRTTVSHRIVDGSLLLRKQVVFRVNHASDFAATMSVRICPHFYDIWVKDSAVECQRLHWECLRPFRGQYSIEGLKGRKGLIQCEFCATEFQIDSGEQGDAIMVTKWQNLGEGESPLDHHAYRQRWMSWERVEFEAGSIRSTFAFEGGEEFAVDFDPFRRPRLHVGNAKARFGSAWDSVPMIMRSGIVTLLW